MQSSRVGDTTSAYAPSERETRGDADARSWRMGTRKASVLPLPVGALTSASRRACMWSRKVEVEEPVLRVEGRGEGDGCWGVAGCRLEVEGMGMGVLGGESNTAGCWDAGLTAAGCSSVVKQQRRARVARSHK
eukprot:112128-Chlamydomonas_euryale.AAC.1